MWATVQTVHYNLEDGANQELTRGIVLIQREKRPLRLQVLVSSPILSSGTLVCPEGILEFSDRAGFERQRKFHRIEIHLLEAAGVTDS